MSKQLATYQWKDDQLSLDTGRIEALKAEALGKSKAVAVGNTKEGYEASCIARQTLKGLIKDATETHKIIKAPFWNAGKKVDEWKITYNAELEAEDARLEKEQKAYLLEEKRKADEIERQRQEAARKLQEDEAKAERLRQEAEAQRIAADEAQKRAQEKLAIAEASTHQLDFESANKAITDAEEAARKAKEAEDARFSAEIEAAELKESAQSVAPVEVTHVTGSSVQYKMSFEVINAEELYKAFPQAFKPLEVKKFIVDDMINRQGIKKIPGVRIFADVATRTRGVSSLIALGKNTQQ